MVTAQRLKQWEKKAQTGYLFSYGPCYLHYSTSDNSVYSLILYSLPDPQKLHSLIVGSVLPKQLDFIYVKCCKKTDVKMFSLTKANFDITFKLKVPPSFDYLVYIII